MKHYVITIVKGGEQEKDGTKGGGRYRRNEAEREEKKVKTKKLDQEMEKRRKKRSVGAVGNENKETKKPLREKEGKG